MPLIDRKGKKIKYKELLAKIELKQREILELDDLEKKNWFQIILEGLVENKINKKLKRKEKKTTNV